MFHEAGLTEYFLRRILIVKHIPHVKAPISSYVRTWFYSYSSSLILRKILVEIKGFQKAWGESWYETTTELFMVKTFGLFPKQWKPVKVTECIQM